MADRDDRERALEALCDTYPKTFFSTPRQRRPLKHRIEQDIAADIASDPKHELHEYDVEDALNWYMSHLSYEIACSSAGAERIDLKGRVVSKVTEKEAREAAAEVERIREVMNARRTPPAATKTAWTFPPDAKPPAADVSMTTDLLLASADKHLNNLVSLLTGDWDEALRNHLARSVLHLIIDELKTIDARLG
jgi:sRNA-binding protein